MKRYKVNFLFLNDTFTPAPASRQIANSSKEHRMTIALVAGDGLDPIDRI
jgi:hypothetical protein